MKITLVLVLAAVFAASLPASALGRLVDEDVLGGRDIQTRWQIRPGLVEGDRLRGMFIAENRLYAISYNNYLFAINRETGRIDFVEKIAAQGIPVRSIDHHQDDIRAMIGDRMYQLDYRIGARIASQRLRYRPVSPITGLGQYYYIAADDGRLRVLRAEDRVELRAVAAEDGTAITWVEPGQTSIFYSTIGGSVVSAPPAVIDQRWSFQVNGAVQGPITSRDDGLYFSSSNGNVYRVNNLQGNLTWRHHTRGIIEQGPQLVDNIVYQHVAGQGLIALSASDGQLLWELATGRELLAKDRQRSYVITDEPKLVVMDNSTGQRLFSVNMAPVQLHVSNSNDAKMYVAGQGYIACIEPRE